MIRKLICRWRGHKWCDWFTVIVNCNDDGSFAYEDWRDCKRCGRHDERTYEIRAMTEAHNG